MSFAIELVYLSDKDSEGEAYVCVAPHLAKENLRPSLSIHFIYYKDTVFSSEKHKPKAASWRHLRASGGISPYVGAYQLEPSTPLELGELEELGEI